MNLDQLIAFFSINPSAKLLCSRHSPYVIFFLNQHFKTDANLATPHSVLRERLGRFLEQVHEADPEILQDRAETYLTKWSTGDTRWLSRYFDFQHSESVYQLTPQTEDVLTFLTGVLERTVGFVGTESRLSRIIQTLADLVVRGSSDPQRRLTYLKSEQKRIFKEIESIESGDAVPTHSPTAIRERFADVVSDLVSLQGDFRAVEESFKSITRDVQKQQIESIDSRGEILGFALDAEDRLKDEDQGASFQAFVRLILSQTQQDRLEQVIVQIDEIAELAMQVEGKHRIKGMIGSLSAEAEKVLRTTRRLSSTLRRLLDSRTSTTRLRLAQVLRDIQATAAQVAENPPDFGIDVFSELDLLNVSQRTFWESPIQFDDVELSINEPDDDDRLTAFRDLAVMQRLDWDAMRTNIASLLRSADMVTLQEVLDLHPPDGGAVEILGYIQLAHDDGHEVDEECVDVIEIDDPTTDNGTRPYEIPRVLFRSGSTEHRAIRRHIAMSDTPEFRECGIAAVRLLQGVVYEDDEDTWAILQGNQSDLADYFCQIGLTLVVDRSEGIAFLKQFDEDERTGGYERLPRLFRKTPLGYEATLLCVLLRDEYRRFEEEDLDNERCVVDLDSLFELWKTYFPAASDEVALRKRLGTNLNQLEKLKFVRKLKSETDSWEIRKLLKARVPIDQLEELLQRLQQDKG